MKDDKIVEGKLYKETFSPPTKQMNYRTRRNQKYIAKESTKIDHIGFMYHDVDGTSRMVYQFPIKPSIYIKSGGFNPNGRVYWKKDCSDKGSFFVHDLIKEHYEHEGSYKYGYFEHYFENLFSDMESDDINMDVLERSDVLLFSDGNRTPKYRFRLSDINPNVCDTTEYRTDFHYKTEKIEKLLLFRNLYLLKNNNALHKACRKGHLYTIRMLVVLGVDINFRNSYGETPLQMLSCMECERCFTKNRRCSDLCYRTSDMSLEVAQTLLSLGANPNIETSSRCISTGISLEGKASNYAKTCGKYRLFGLLKIAENDCL